MAEVVLEKVNKVYANGFHAVKDLDLRVGDGELMVLVGPSGCGKTTILRMIAGLEDITSGKLLFGGKLVNDLEPKDRDIAMVFQSYALYPHMTVAENIAFALKLRKVPKAEIEKKVKEAAEILDLTESLSRKPKQLSGGQRQRVAMGRAIVREPKVFLMDEPLSNLDAKLRVRMRSEILRIHQHLGVATVYVTHDQVEAMTMGDRVAVLKDGILLQCDAPQVLYEQPVNTFVATFIGSPAMNLYLGKLDDGAKRVQLGSQLLELPEEVKKRVGDIGRYAGQPIIVGIRPEEFQIATEENESALWATVDIVELLGPEVLIHFSIDAETVASEGQSDSLEGSGVARLPVSVSITKGSKIKLLPNFDQMHFFDPSTTEAIR